MGAHAIKRVPASSDRTPPDATMKPVDAPSAWTSPSDLDKKESDGRDPHLCYVLSYVLVNAQCVLYYGCCKGETYLRREKKSAFPAIWKPPFAQFARRINPALSMPATHHVKL